LAYGEPKTEQMTHIASPEGVITTQEYNLFGSSTKITQDGVEQLHFYNGRQQLCKQVRPDTGVTAYGLNTIGEVIWAAKGASGNKTSCDEANVLASEKTLYTHDNLGANKTINYPDSSADITYTYDNQGSVKTLVAGTVTQTYNYFSGGVLQNENLQVDSKDLTIHYNYDGMQSLNSTIYPDGRTVSYAPNAFGEATKAGGYATGVAYFPDGQVKNYTFGNGLTHTTTLNASKMPSNILASAGAMNYDYTYDNQGNLKTQTDNIDSAYSISGMAYDGLDRLTAANGFWGNVSIGYDKLGNITNYNFDDTGTLTYTYNANNQLENVSGSQTRTFTYDERGNVTNDGKQALTFNRAQRITTIGANNYLYDGHGRRVKRESATLGTSYSMYSQSGKLLYREKADGTKVDYVFLGKQQVARVEDGIASYIHTDLLGSPVVESDANGAVLASTRMHYRPFGETKETPKDEVGYTGHKFDTDTGLNYMQQRYYDPSIGRFYSDDPVGYKAKNPVMSFNRYLYVNNNPYKYTDPDGEFIHMIVGAAIGAAIDAGLQTYKNYQSGQSLGESISNVDLGSVAVSAALGASGAVGSQLIKGALTGTLKVGSQSVAVSSGVERAVVGTLGVANASATGTAIAGVKGKSLSTGSAVQVANGVAPGLGSVSELAVNKVMESISESDAENTDIDYTDTEK
jgi:RHS repeat-associated protein